MAFRQQQGRRGVQTPLYSIFAFGTNAVQVPLRKAAQRGDMASASSNRSAIRIGLASAASAARFFRRSDHLRLFATLAVELRHGDAGIMRQEVLAHVFVGIAVE